MSQAPYSVILLEPLVGSMETLARVLEKSSQFELMRVPTHEEAYQAALQFDPCLLLLSIPAGLDGAGELALLKRLEKRVRSGGVRVLTISGRKGNVLGRQAAGFGDYIEEPVPMKSIVFKVKLLVKALSARQAETSGQGEEKVFRADAAAAPAAEVPSGYVAALQLGEDTFVFKKAKPRLQGGEIVLEAEGPLPETGEWVEEPGGESWRWVQKLGEDGEPKADDGDGWVHRGKKPTYQPAKGKWELRSDMPELAYRRGGQLVAAKVRLSDTGRVEIADDSPEAVNNLMVNRTLAAQARGRLIQQVMSGQQEEAGAKTPAAGEEPNRARKAGTAAAGEEESEKKPAGPASPGAASEAARKQLKVSALRDRLRKQKESGEENPGDEKDAAEKAAVPGEEEAARARKEAAEPEGREEPVAGKLALERFEKKREAARRAAGASEPEESEERKEAIPAEEEAREKTEKAARKKSERGGRRAGARQAGEAEKEENPNPERAGAIPDGEHPAAETEAEPADDQARAKAARQALREERSRARREAPAAGEEELARRGEETAEPPEEAEEAEATDAAAADGAEGEAARRALARAERRRSPREKEGEEELPEEPASAATVHDLAAEGAEGALDRRGAADRKERAFRAIESLGEEAGEMGVDRIAAAERAEPARKEFFLDASEVQPYAGTWIEAEGHFAYLPDEALDNGFRALKELLPLWIYEGTEPPELTGTRWRFFDRPPELAEEERQLPSSVREALEEIRGQAALALGHEPLPLPAGIAKSVARHRRRAEEGSFEELEAPEAGEEGRKRLDGEESGEKAMRKRRAGAQGAEAFAPDAQPGKGSARGSSERSEEGSAFGQDARREEFREAEEDISAAAQEVSKEAGNSETDRANGAADAEREAEGKAETSRGASAKATTESGSDPGPETQSGAESESTNGEGKEPATETAPETSPPDSAPERAPDGGMPLTSLLVLAYLSDLRRLPDVPTGSLHVLAGLLSAAIPSRVFVYTEEAPPKGAEVLPAGARGWFVVRAFSVGPLSFEDESLLLAAAAALPKRRKAA